MRHLFIAIALLACGDSTERPIDAPVVVADAPAAAFDCETYCTRMQTNCIAVNGQYPEREQCIGTCRAFPLGTEADTTGNTLGCRLNHASLARSNPALHCFYAGPTGASPDGTTAQCGTDCDAFCSIAMATCISAYADLAVCKSACEGFTSTPPFKINASGNTRECRLYHATNAANTKQTPANVTLHCGHATAMADQAPCKTP